MDWAVAFAGVRRIPGQHFSPSESWDESCPCPSVAGPWRGNSLLAAKGFWRKLKRCTAMDCDGLSRDDEATLLVAAEQFEAAGYLAFALETAHRSAEAARRNGHRAGALRGTEMTNRLKADGVMPTFSMRFSGTPKRLTAREMEIAVMAARGSSNRELSDTLGLSRRTVETHLQRIYRKIGVNDRTSLSEILASA